MLDFTKQRKLFSSISKTTRKSLNNSLNINEINDFKKQNKKQLIEIKSVIEKLSKVAMDLSTPKFIASPFLPLDLKDTHSTTIESSNAAIFNLNLGNNTAISNNKLSIHVSRSI